MDWTQSPYIAAFFALEGAIQEKSASCSVWVLNRTLLEKPLLEGWVDIIDDRALLRFNTRALEQRGVFLKVMTMRQPLELLLDTALTRLDLRFSDRTAAMAELDAMTITAKSLLRDLDGAARTAVTRLTAHNSSPGGI